MIFVCVCVCVCVCGGGGGREAGIDEEGIGGGQAKRMQTSYFSLQAHKCAQPTHPCN